MSSGSNGLHGNIAHAGYLLISVANDLGSQCINLNIFISIFDGNILILYDCMYYACLYSLYQISPAQQLAVRNNMYVLAL